MTRSRATLKAWRRISPAAASLCAAFAPIAVSAQSTSQATVIATPAATTASVSPDMQKITAAMSAVAGMASAYQLFKESQAKAKAARQAAQAGTAVAPSSPR